MKIFSSLCIELKNAIVLNVQPRRYPLLPVFQHIPIFFLLEEHYNLISLKVNISIQTVKTPAISTDIHLFQECIIIIEACNLRNLEW